MTYPVTPPDDDPNAEAGAQLLLRGGLMLTTLLEAGHDLTEPENVLALQLLGPMISRAIGGNIDADMETVKFIAKGSDITKFQELIRGMAK